MYTWTYTNYILNYHLFNTFVLYYSLKLKLHWIKKQNFYHSAGIPESISCLGSNELHEPITLKSMQDYASLCKNSNTCIAGCKWFFIVIKISSHTGIKNLGKEEAHWHISSYSLLRTCPTCYPYQNLRNWIYQFHHHHKTPWAPPTEQNNSKEVSFPQE